MKPPKLSKTVLTLILIILSLGLLKVSMWNMNHDKNQLITIFCLFGISLITFVALSMSSRKYFPHKKKMPSVDQAVYCDNVARVFVNNVEVGSLPADLYKNIVSSSFSNKFLYALQLFNTIKIILRFSVAVIFNIPKLWFIILLLLVVLNPNDLTVLFSKMSNMTPSEYTIFVSSCLGYGSLINGIVYMIAGAIGAMHFGYENQFQKAIYRRIREILEVPAEGSMHVIVTQATGDNGQ